MPEVTNLHPNDATDSSSEEETTWPTAGYQPRRESFRPQIPESQQAADDFTTSSSENSLEEYQFSETPRLRRRTRSSIRAEENAQQNDESIGIDSDLTNEVNLPVVTDTASMTSEEDVTWIRRHEQSGLDSDSERSNSPEMLSNADLNEAIFVRQDTQTIQEAWMREVRKDRKFCIVEKIVYLLFEYARLTEIDKYCYREMNTKDQNSLGKSFELQHKVICLTISSV